MEFFNDYYIGLLLLNPLIYDKNIATRIVNGINYDPFCECDMPTAIFQGTLTLVRKVGDKYCLEYESRYKNEIILNLGETNKYGIYLAYIKPFCEVYQKRPKLLIKEEIENDYDKMCELLFNDEYYLSFSKMDKSIVPVIINENNMNLVREEYYDKFFRNKTYEKK